MPSGRCSRGTCWLNKGKSNVQTIGVDEQVDLEEQGNSRVELVAANAHTQRSRKAYHACKVFADYSGVCCRPPHSNAHGSTLAALPTVGCLTDSLSAKTYHENLSVVLDLVR